MCVIFLKFSQYLSPELSIDVVGCESCNLPFLGNWTQVTCCHHETNHTIPVGAQSLILAPGRSCAFNVCRLHFSQGNAAWPAVLLKPTPPPGPLVMAWPVWVVVQVQRLRGQQLRQLLVVVEVQGQVRGNDGLPDDLQHLLILAGI